MIKAFHESDADLIELNLSCPNIPGKPQLAYDFDETDKTLKTVCGLGDKPLGLKLPPYFDFVHFERMAEVILRYPVSFISCINSVGNTMVIDPELERPVIRPKNGFGGLSGQYLKPIGLANVRAFSQLLGGKVQVVGVGGVVSGLDAFEYLLAGADAIQVGTTYEKEGVDCFERIHQELADVMQRKGYASLDQVRGKLKSFDE
jgi:dihydroorotate dehydrogenase (fumarate)